MLRSAESAPGAAGCEVQRLRAAFGVEDVVVEAVVEADGAVSGAEDALPKAQGVVQAGIDERALGRPKQGVPVRQRGARGIKARQTMTPNSS